ncbi:DUF5117 domain-containing protein [Flavihumibacter sp. R14]|nr:DUF5117 domain-containing protein [Flavihumibacter soli]
MQKFPGYFDFYYDAKQDKIFLLITKFDEEFLYVNSLPAGIGSNDIGLDRGQLGDSRVVKFEKRGPKVLMVEPNYRYRAITDNANERRAVEEAFAQSVLWGFKAEAEADGAVLVDATDFYLQDVHDVTGTLKSAQQGTYTLDKTRSAFYLPRTKNFPQNSEVEVTLTYTGTATGGFIRSVTPTPSAVTVRQHHSFVKLPDAGYKPRKFDPRAGYFSTAYYDYSTPIDEPIEKRFITRHRLQKKDPSAAMSEAVKPIIYYLDNGTPEPIRSALLDGARWWNQAFEAAGYKDAFRVEILPEGADPMDVRYNLIQWVHRSTRGWSYGASVSDPRTGEIIKGHVSLGSLRVRQDYLIAEGLLSPYAEGQAVSPEMKAMALARLRQLSAHEVGHTIGLAHAYSSSSEELASVMDYPHPGISMENGKISLANAYDAKIGAWDKVAVNYGYREFAKGENEDQALNAILQNSLKEGLTFLSDQDARPLGSAHPYTHLWDNGKDAADELNRIMGIRKVVLDNFSENMIKPGMPMATLEEALVPMYFLHRYQTEAASKIIGGLNYRYALRGDGQAATELIDPAWQKKALDAVLSTLNSKSLMIPEKVLQLIPPRPLGYSRHRELFNSRTGLTFDAMAAVEAAADMSVSLLLQPERAARLIEHNARDSKQPSFYYVLDKLLGATIYNSSRDDYQAAVQMTINDVVLLNLFRLSLNKQAPGSVKAATNYKLELIKNELADRLKSTTTDNWRAHYSYLVQQINTFRDKPEEFTLPVVLAPPPGQPIGMMGCD